jgi:5-formyltetrahydrofolate cyclo-ligase
MNTPNDDPIAEQKAALRQDALARRDAIPVDFRRGAAETIAARELPFSVTTATVISGYSPIKSELSPLPLLRHCALAGASLALPAIARRGEPLIMRSWAFGDTLGAGVWGIREPAADAAEIFPDVVLAPLLAFDRRGYRLGYGAGYYDLTLHRLRALRPVLAVGLAFAAQEVPEVPATRFDARLDLVLTEREIIDFRPRQQRG